MQTYRQRLANTLALPARNIVHCPARAEAMRVQQIRAKAERHLAANPAPRAVYLLG